MNIPLSFEITLVADDYSSSINVLCIALLSNANILFIVTQYFLGNKEYVASELSFNRHVNGYNCAHKDISQYLSDLLRRPSLMNCQLKAVSIGNDSLKAPQ